MVYVCDRRDVADDPVGVPDGDVPARGAREGERVWRRWLVDR